MGKTATSESDRWAVPRSRSTFNLNDDDDDKNKKPIGRWFSTAKLDDEEHKSKVVDTTENERTHSSSRRRSTIKDEIVNFFHRRRSSVPVVQLRTKEEKSKATPVQTPIQIEDEVDSDGMSLSSSPPLAAFLIVDRSLLPPPPPPRRFSLGNILKKK